MKYWFCDSGDYPPYFHNIYMENIHSRGSQYVLHTDGLPGKNWTNGIFFSDCTFENVSNSEINQIIGTENVSFKNCNANGKKM